MKILLIFSFLLLSLFSSAGDASAQACAEGQVIAVLELSPQARSLMCLAKSSSEGMTSFKSALACQAERFAEKSGITAQAVDFAQIALATGKNIIILTSDKKSTAEMIAELKKDPEVLSVQPNNMSKPLGTGKTN